MKKLFLLCVLIGASQLYGMEPIKIKENAQKEALAIYTSSEMLPEIRREIINIVLATSKNVDETISMIEKFSILHQVEFDPLFNNLKDFTKLVHMLADKFIKYRTSNVARKFGRSIADDYIKLGEELLKSVLSESTTDVVQLINQGADINYTTTDGLNSAPLMAAVNTKNLNMVELLLNLGANPYFKEIEIGTPFDRNLYILTILKKNNTKLQAIKDREAIKTLLEKAMQK